jgi:hypothetical protein
MLMPSAIASPRTVSHPGTDCASSIRASAPVVIPALNASVSRPDDAFLPHLAGEKRLPVGLNPYEHMFA